MKTRTIVQTGVCVAAMLALAPMGAYAFEGGGVTALQPGVTTGNAAGALPPPGRYYNTDADWETGTVVNGSGHKITVAGQHLHASNVAWVNSLLWVPGWRILGADYGAMIAQPIKWASTHWSGGSTYKSGGLMGTVVSPEMLSWNLGSGFHVSEGMAFVINDGYTTSAYSAAAGRNTTTNYNLANAFYTFEPSFAISYLNNGWNLTANNVVDINTKNQTTDYQSGHIYYLDLTASKRIGNWTFGLLGNYTQQFTDDEIGGVVVPASDNNSRGNRVMHIKAGPLVAYDFGRFQVTARYLQALKTRNDCDVSFFHVGLSMKLD
jgi:hypothetical protein